MLLIWVATAALVAPSVSAGGLADDRLDIRWLAESSGLSVESHQVVTDDDYILTAHRLVNPSVSEPTGVVVLLHGILSASPLFLMGSRLDAPAACEREPGRCSGRTRANETTTTSNSLAVALARLGLDVWLPNTRGTENSRGHMRLDAGSDPEYWDFSADALVELDLAAHVRYMLEQTGGRKYSFVGHSLGATVGLGALLVHRNSSVVSKLACSVLVAPVASVQFVRGNLLSILRFAASTYKELSPFPGFSMPLELARTVCTSGARVCLYLASLFLGEGVESHAGHLDAHLSATVDLLDAEDLATQIDTFALLMRQSASIKMIRHILQVNRSGRLAKFDLGSPARNRELYGTPTPPAYDLSKIRQPNLKLLLVSGATDVLSTPDEIAWISRKLRGRVGVLESFAAASQIFNHLDLLISGHAGRLVNERVIDFMQRNECFQ